MAHIFGIACFIAVLGFFIWLFSDSTGIKSSERLKEDEPIDSEDQRQISILIGMTGGSITSAASAKFALKRFEETYGRKATIRDLGVITGFTVGFSHAQNLFPK